MQLAFQKPPVQAVHSAPNAIAEQVVYLLLCWSLVGIGWMEMAGILK